MTRRLGVIALALTLALVGTSLVFAYVNRADARAVAGLHPKNAYVAVKTIPSGTSLSAAVRSGLAKQEALPERTVPFGAVTHLAADLRAKVAIADIQAGQVLFAAAFGSKPAQQSGLRLPTGTLAVSLSLGDPQRVGDFVEPGAKIAIFDTFNTVLTFDEHGRLGSGNRNAVAGDDLGSNHAFNHQTRLLLKDVVVLAIGATTQPTPLASASAKPTTGSATATVLVTVAVEQRDAEKLIQGIQTGHLYLALQGPDAQVAPSRGVDDTNLFN
jgi:pilus assembly protein CpaB